MPRRSPTQASHQQRYHLARPRLTLFKRREELTLTELSSSNVRVKAQLLRKGIVALNTLVFFVGGVWLGYGVVDRWYWENAQQNWASTDGIIETTYVHRAFSRHVNWETGWTYSYILNGQKYVARSTALNNAYFVHMFSSERRAEDDEEMRPVGSTVSVYYDPALPQHSVLDLPQDSLFDILTLILSAMSIGVAILSGIALVKALKNQPVDD
jgi:hypothetical protein